MKKSVFKRGTAMVMAMVMCLMAFLGSGPLTAHAAGEKAEVYMIGFPRDGEADFNGWGHPELHYMNGCFLSGQFQRALQRRRPNLCGVQ